MMKYTVGTAVKWGQHHKIYPTESRENLVTPVIQQRHPNTRGTRPEIYLILAYSGNGTPTVTAVTLPAATNGRMSRRNAQCSQHTPLAMQHHENKDLLFGDSCLE